MINGMSWSFTGTALAKFLTLLAGIFCAHILEQKAYGEFSMVRSTINMFVVLGAGGLGVTATKYISEFRQSHKDRISDVYLTTNSFAVITGIICALLILFFSDTIASKFLGEPKLGFPLQIGSILLFFSILNGVQNGTLMGFEDFRSIAKNTLLGSLFESIFMIVGAYLYGINGAILGFGIGFIVIYVCNKLTISRLFKNYGLHYLSIKSMSKENLKIVFNYSIPAALSSLLITPTFWLIRSMLVKECDFNELAIFEAADQWKVIILFIPTAISQIVLPLLSSLQEERNTFNRTLLLNLTIIISVSTAIAILIFFFSDLIMNLYGTAYNNSIPLKILALSTVFSAIANVLEMSIYSKGKMWECFLINTLWSIAVIFSTHVFLQKGLGASGLAYAILLSYILTCICFGGYTFCLFHKNGTND